MKNLRVVQFQGLAPSVFCGLYFADQGAEVIFVARAESAPISMQFSKNMLNRNKKCIEINLKNKQHFEVIKQLIRTADIVIDPFRPGVLQKLKLGPKQLRQINKKVILLRVSGYGQSGQNKLRPGHDINYVSVSGMFPLINQQGQNQFAANYSADFVSASLGITGVLGALHRRQLTGEGGQVDCSLTNGCTYLAQNMIEASKNQVTQKELIKTFKIGGKQYIATGKDAVDLNEESVKSIMKGKDSYRAEDGSLEISEVKAIGPFDTKALKNPFSREDLSNILRKKGENSQQIFASYLPKL